MRELARIIKFIYNILSEYDCCHSYVNFVNIGGFTMNFHNKKTQKTISAVIVVILILAMIIPSLLGILGI